MRVLRHSPERNERGVAAILVSALLVVVVGILAFAVDFSLAYSNQRNLQNASDAAVLAAGGVILEQSSSGQTCVEMIQDTTASGEPIDLAKAAAAAAFDSNVAAEASLDELTFDCDDPRFDDNLVISASGTHESPGIFGYGQDHYDLMKPAKSMIGPAGRLEEVRPFAICDPSDEPPFLTDQSPGTYLTVNFENDDLGCGGAAGNFGTLDMRDAYIPPAGPSVPGCPGNEVEDWIESGYPGSIPVHGDLYINGEPGIPSSNFSEEFQSILEDAIIIPTYDVRDGTGCNNARYHITGFVEVQICGFKLTSGAGALTESTCFDDTQAPADAHDRFVQIKFVRFIPVGDLNLTCNISTCNGDPLVLKLAQ